MPFDPTDPNSLAANQFVSPLSGMAQDRATGMLNQPQLKVFAQPQSQPFQDGGTNFSSPIMPTQTQLGNMMPGTLAMKEGGQVEGDELASIKDQIRQEFASRGLDFDRFVSNPAVMDEVGKSIQEHGHDGDTILAHINPEEARLLEKHGGSGTINPDTGLRQFSGADTSGSSVTSSNYGGGSTRDSSSSNQSSGYSSSGSGGGRDTSGGLSVRAGSTPGFGSGGGGTIGGGGGYGSSATGLGGPGTGGSISGGGGGGGGLRSPTFAGAPNAVSPTGVGGNALSLGQSQQPSLQATGAQPTFAGVNPLTGMPLGASSLSGLGQLASVPSGLGAAPSAPAASPIDSSISPVGLSSVDFSNMNAGMAPGAVMPGGISNYAASPTNPGYTDIGTTAMRMAAGMPGGEGYRSQSTEFNLGKLGEFSPVAQTQAATILNRMMDQGYAPGFDPFGVGRTMAEQAALKANAGPYLTAEPGKSFHNFGLAMDVENLPEAGYRDLARIAQEEGWGSGGALDPAHVQMAPWGAGAMQTAQRVGAEPFTMASRAAEQPSSLQTALNTVSNIAGELFGVKSAQAQEAPQRDYLSEMYQQSEPFGGAEIMSPFVGSNAPNMGMPPQSQQQMLDALGISGRPVPAAPTQREMLDALGIKGPTYEGLLPGQQKYQERAPSETQLQNILSPANVFPMTKFGRPEEMATYGAEQAAPSDLMSGISSFDFGGIRSPEQAAAVAEAQREARINELADIMGTNPQGNYLFSELTPGATIPNTATVNVPEAIKIYNPWLATPQQVYQGLVQKLTGTPENKTGTWTPGAIDPETGLPTTGVATWPTPDFSKMTDQEIKDYQESLSKYSPAMKLTPQYTTAPTTNWGAPAAGLSPYVSSGVAPASFADLTPLAAAQASNLPTPQQLAPLASLSYGARSELPAEGSRMTTEQLKDFGVYKEPLKEGQTVRENFNEAYADARERGLTIFEWTNPSTGKSDVYSTELTRSGGGGESKSTSAPTPGGLPQVAAPQAPSGLSDYAARLRNAMPNELETYGYRPEYRFYS